MLFAKNKTGKKVTFDGGWVELQYLSKGVKDDYKGQLAELYSQLSGLDKETIAKMEKGDLQAVPESMAGLVAKINQLEYFKLSKAIKKWSETETPINEDTVKELDETVFDRLVKEVNEMNELTDGERKN
jgi:hypothetical protein